MHKGVNKGAGLLKLADILGVRPEETMAIGDNINDIDMLKAAGLSIGVRNLNPAIRQYCDVVTDATTTRRRSRSHRKIRLISDRSLYALQEGPNFQYDKK